MTEASLADLGRRGVYLRPLGSPQIQWWACASVAGTNSDSLPLGLGTLAPALCTGCSAGTYLKNSPADLPHISLATPKAWVGVPSIRFSVSHPILEHKSGFSQQGRREGGAFCVWPTFEQCIQWGKMAPREFCIQHGE